MKRLGPFLACSLFFIFLLPLDAQWARTFGGSGNDRAYSVHQTNDGGYIIAGATDSFGAGKSDFWVLKLSLAGAVSWERTYGGSEDDIAYFIRQTGDNGYIIAGSTQSFGNGGSDFWVIKLNSNGNIEWQRTFGDSGNDAAYSVRQTSDGGYIVAGSLYFVGSNSTKFWVLKLSSAGNIEWQQAFGGSLNDYLLSFDQTSDGGYVAAGYSNSFGTMTFDFWVLRLSSTGNITWQQFYGGSGNDIAQSIQQTTDGGYIVAGTSNSFSAGDSDFWILKLGTSGDIAWQSAYSGTANDYLLSVKQAGDGGYIAAGYTSSFGTRGLDFWLSKLSPTGNIVWQQTYGGTAGDCLTSVEETSDGGYVAAGYTDSFGAGSSDILIVKLFSNGDIDSRCELPSVSTASMSNTSSFQSWTLTTPSSTSYPSQDTSVSAQETAATTILLCEYRPSISGTVKTADGQGISGVAVTFSDGGGDTSTNAQGYYSHAVSYGWSGTATPSKEGYIFSPTSRTYANVTSDQTDQDFVTSLVCNISGRVKTAEGVGIEGATVNFSAGAGTATTDSTGYYSCPVSYGWSGTATPSKACYAFSPPSRTYSDVVTDLPNQDYTAAKLTYTISGTVRLASSSAPLAGVEMKGLPGNPTTNASGYYEVTVDCGWSGTVSPSRERYVFSPTQRIYASVTSNQTGQDYSAYPGWIVSGSVKNYAGQAMTGVTLVFSAEGGTSITDNNGNYSRTVKEGWSGSATPGKTGYTFSPSSRDYSNVTSDWSNQDYTGTPIPRTLRIIADPGGTTDPSPGDYTYSHGAQVSVTAIPDSGYEFSRWAEDLPLGHEKDNPLNLTLDSNKTVRATFEKKAACFVATAAYGSAFDPQVKTLQDFRDKYLIPYKLGREIVELYYKYSPAAANLISKHRILKFFARLLLLPILTFSTSMLRYGPLFTAVIAAFIIGFSILAVRFYRKKLRARR